MTDKDDNDAIWGYISYVIAIILAALLIVWVIDSKNYIHDLQRRVGQLESERR